MCRMLHPSWCFYAGIWGIVFGVALSLLFRIIVITNYFWLAVGILIFLFTLAHPTYFTAAIAFVLGICLANLRCSVELISQDYFSQLVGAELTIMGDVSDEPALSANQATVHLEHLRIKLSDGSWLSQSGTIYVQLAGKLPVIERSDRLTISGKLGDGFGTFAASVFRPKLESLQRASTGDLPSRIKHWFANVIRDSIPSPEVDLGLGYLVGMKSGLPDDLSTTLQTVGMTHVVVASGAHLGILVGAAKKFFGKISKFAALLFSLLLIAGFVLMIGFTPSMTRAALVSSLSLCFGYFGRRWTPLRLISFVAAITLLLNPINFLNLGWQLSFASFFGLMVIGPRLTHFFYGGKTPPWLASMLLTSLSTTIICAPILIYNFGSLSLLSFIANLFILPTLPYAMLLVFLTGATSFLPFCAVFFARLATWLLDFHIFIVNFLNEKRMFIIEAPAGNLAVFLIYFPLLLALFLPKITAFFSSHLTTRTLSISK